jgi:hypothetical protein
LLLYFCLMSQGDEAFNEVEIADSKFLATERVGWFRESMWVCMPSGTERPPRQMQTMTGLNIKREIDIVDNLQLPCIPELCKPEVPG